MKVNILFKENKAGRLTFHDTEFDQTDDGQQKQLRGCHYHKMFPRSTGKCVEIPIWTVFTAWKFALTYLCTEVNRRGAFVPRVAGKSELYMYFLVEPNRKR